MSYTLSLALVTLSFSLTLLTAATDSTISKSSSCRRLLGDDGWPSPQEWAQLNATVQGRLIATVPLGAPCHDPTYNATECSLLQAEWPEPPVQ